MAETAWNDGGGNSAVNITVAFLGDETNSLPADMGGIAYKGLRDLVSLTDMPENRVLCYLDADEVPERIVIRHGIRGYVAPLAVIKPLPRFFNAMNIPWSFRIRYNEIYKLGLVEGHEALIITSTEGVNSFALSGSFSETNISGDNTFTGTAQPRKAVPAPALAKLLLAYSESLNFPVLEADTHYSTFTAPGGETVLFIGEGVTAAIFIIVAGIFLLLFLIYSVRYNVVIVSLMKHFFKHIWIFFALLPLLVFSVKISSLIYSTLLEISGFNHSGGFANYGGAALTAILASFIFVLPSPVLNLFHFPRRARFYGFSAVIFTSLGMLLAALLDFTYTLVFIWAFLFVLLGSWIKKPFLIFLCALAAPLFAFGALLNIIETDSPRIVELFISPEWNSLSSWFAVLQIAMLSLPLFLLMKRGSILHRSSANRGVEQKPDRITRVIVISILMALVLGMMIMQIRLLPEGDESGERRFITEETTGGKNEILNLSLDDIIFQDSRIITVKLHAGGNPARFDIALESESGENLPPLYSSPVPFERTEEGKRIVFSLGERAPNPLVFEFVVPLGFEALLKTRALYNVWDPAIDPGEKPAAGDYVLIVSKDLKLSTSGIQP